MTLHGPAHPDEFRVKVGRYGDRWYHDPLPADDRWPATDAQWPSVTTIKKASSRDWSWTSLERAADYIATRRNELDGLNAKEIHARLLEINKSGLNRAADRGTSIHNIIEAMATGQTIATALIPDAEPYLPACEAFLNDHQPEWIASEAVVIHRGEEASGTPGYGGTFDAILCINGTHYLVDWKTRKAGKHGAYDEEAMQIAAYGRAEYMIAEVNGAPQRVDVPVVEGGLIVSIAPEGYRLYPVAFDAATSAWLSLAWWWQSKQLDMIGKPVILCPPKPRPTPLPTADPFDDIAPAIPKADEAEVAKVLKLVERIKEQPGGLDALKARWPAIPPAKRSSEWSADQVVNARIACNWALADIGASFMPEQTEVVIPTEMGGFEVPLIKPPLTPAPEGPDADPAALAILENAVHELTPTQRAALGSLTKAALQAGVDFRPSVRPSVRRFELGRAALAVAEVLEADEDLTRAALALVLNGEPFRIDLGAIIGCFRPEQAIVLERIVRAIGVDYRAETVDGVVRLVAA